MKMIGFKRITIIFSLISIGVLLVWFFNKFYNFNYDRDNYRYAFSAALQSLSTLLALIASSTVLVMQMNSENSPKSLEFFPKRVFLHLLIYFSILIFSDGLILLFLPENNSIQTLFIFIFNFTILLNGAIIFFIIKYVFIIIEWFKPETTIDLLIQKSKSVSSNIERSNILRAIEEIAKKAIQRGYGSTVKYIIDNYEEIINIFINSRPELNADIRKNPNNPFRIIPESISRISVELCRSNLDDLVHLTAYPLVYLTKLISDDEDLENVDVGILNTSERIVEECCKYGLESASYNFIGDLAYPRYEQESYLSLITWYLKGIISVGIKYKNPIIISHSIEAISDLLDKVVSLETIKSLKRAIKSLEEEQEIHKEFGWFQDENIGEQLRKVKKQVANKFNDVG